MYVLQCDPYTLVEALQLALFQEKYLFSRDCASKNSNVIDSGLHIPRNARYSAQNFITSNVAGPLDVVPFNGCRVHELNVYVSLLESSLPPHGLILKESLVHVPTQMREEANDGKHQLVRQSQLLGITNMQKDGHWKRPLPPLYSCIRLSSFHLGIPYYILDKGGTCSCQVIRYYEETISLESTDPLFALEDILPEFQILHEDHWVDVMAIPRDLVVMCFDPGICATITRSHNILGLLSVQL